MSLAPERPHEKETPQELTWELIEITDPDKLLEELLEFWARQTPQDLRNRFYAYIDLDEVRNRYHHSFRLVRLALELRDQGQLVGFALGTVDPKEADWVQTSTEIDINYRNQGYGGQANELIYFFARSRGFAGVKCEALAENSVSCALMAKLARDKPHVISQKFNVICYFIGDHAKMPFDFDAIE